MGAENSFERQSCTKVAPPRLGAGGRGGHRSHATGAWGAERARSVATMVCLMGSDKIHDGCGSPPRGSSDQVTGVVEWTNAIEGWHEGLRFSAVWRRIK